MKDISLCSSPDEQSEMCKECIRNPEVTNPKETNQSWIIPDYYYFGIRDYRCNDFIWKDE